MQLHCHAMQNRDYAAQYFSPIRDNSVRTMLTVQGCVVLSTELLHRNDLQSHYSLAHIGQKLEKLASCYSREVFYHRNSWLLKNKVGKIRTAVLKQPIRMIKNLSSPYQTALAGKAIRNEPDNYAVRPLMKLTTVLSASRKRDSVKFTHARHSLYATPMYEQYFGMRRQPAGALLKLAGAACDAVCSSRNSRGRNRDLSANIGCRCMPLLTSAYQPGIRRNACPSAQWKASPVQEIKLINSDARRGCSSNAHNQRASVLFLALLLIQPENIVRSIIYCIALAIISAASSAVSLVRKSSEWPRAISTISPGPYSPITSCNWRIGRSLFGDLVDAIARLLLQQQRFAVGKQSYPQYYILRSDFVFAQYKYLTPGIVCYQRVNVTRRYGTWSRQSRREPASVFRELTADLKFAEALELSGIKSVDIFLEAIPSGLSLSEKRPGNKTSQRRFVPVSLENKRNNTGSVFDAKVP
ncbi:hypothetical protein EAG_09923 [Camponotus floridanus]|uniref:Uncharacterized protein n=1 Tax=Camponotus floridanus TaxID=104421 RepID=E2A6E8_CAMFO|nr:hypothetical protein EAG_09923 [Camponotus floridanus]